MALQGNTEYEGVCTGASWIRSSNNNPGFQVIFQCKDGNAYFTIWLAGKDKQKAKDKAAKNLRTLGATDEEMKSAAFLNYQLPQIILNKKFRFGTAEEEYNGRKRVKVIWIAPPRKESDSDAGREAAAFFGGNGDQPKPPFRPVDDDVPFS